MRVISRKLKAQRSVKGQIHFVNERPLRLRQVPMYSALHIEKMLDHIFDLICSPVLLVYTPSNFPPGRVPSTLFGSLTGAINCSSPSPATCSAGSCGEAGVSNDGFVFSGVGSW